MSHVRCFAHALVTAVSLIAWAGVVWLMLAQPSANDEWRLPFFAVLGVAVGSSSLALFPVVVVSYLKRYTDLIDQKTFGEAMWNLGCAHGRREQRRKHEVLHEPIAPRARFKLVDQG